MKLRVVFNRQSATPIKPRATHRGQLYYLGQLPGHHRFVAFQVTGVSFLKWLFVTYPEKYAVEDIKQQILTAFKDQRSDFLQTLITDDIRIISMNEPHLPCKVVGEFGSGMYFQYTGHDVTLTYTYVAVKDGELLPITNIPFAQRRVPRGTPLPTEFGENFLIQTNGQSTWALLPGDGTLTRQQVSKILRDKPQSLLAVLLEGSVMDIPSIYPLERRTLADYDVTDAKYFYSTDYIAYRPEVFIETLTLRELLRKVNTDVLTHVLRLIRTTTINDQVAKEIAMVKGARGDIRICEPNTGIPFKSSAAAFQYLKRIGLFQ
jgi:hypothetical protein